jgi:hypothetical protein
MLLTCVKPGSNPDIEEKGGGGGKAGLECYGSCYIVEKYKTSFFPIMLLLFLNRHYN